MSTRWHVTSTTAAEQRRVRLRVEGWWGMDADATGTLVLDARDPVGLAEKLVDALTDDEREHLREYLGGAK